MMKLVLLIAALLSALAFPNISLGQSPNLGAATNFTLFTVTGAVTNVGTSYISSNIGYNTGSYSGFEPAFLDGQVHQGDATALAVAADVVALYNSLVATPCTTVLSSPELGSQTLTAGVYCQNTASPTTLNGTLTLRGGGIFIFKLSSALTTAGLSKIVLTNGAISANNVYFQVQGAATLGVTGAAVGAPGSTSYFAGNIVAKGAIVLNNTSLTGRALSTVGAITVNASFLQTLIPPPPTPTPTPTPPPVTAGTIDCSKTQIYPAPVAGTATQLSLLVTINVTTAGTFTPTVSGSGMSLAMAGFSVTATATGVQQFHIPIKYDGSPLGSMIFSASPATPSCTADLTVTPKSAISSVWALDNCTLVRVGPGLR